MGLLLLADGMGGYKAGDIASEIALLVIATELSEAMSSSVIKSASGNSYNANFLPESNFLIDAVKKANTAIYQVSQEQSQCAGMGTTLVAGIFTNNKLIVGHIGDSRLYRLRGESFTQLTEDHSYVQEQLNAGLMTEIQAKTSQYKNLVTRALGVDPHVELEINVHHVELHDIFLLCSDGLTDLVTDEEICKTLLHASGNITLAAKKLIQSANEHGGADNSSVVIAKVNKEFAVRKNSMRKFF
jgi:protein phosphatase